MGQLITTPQRTEPITYFEVVAKSDGQGGTLGNLQAVKTVLATVKPLKSTRTLEANQTQLRQGYQFTHWVDPSFEPKVNSIISYRDEQLVLEQYSYEDNTRKRYVVTALEGSYQNGNGSQS